METGSHTANLRKYGTGLGRHCNASEPLKWLHRQCLQSMFRVPACQLSISASKAAPIQFQTDGDVAHALFTCPLLRCLRILIRPEFVKQFLIQYHTSGGRRRMSGAPMFASSNPQNYVSIVSDFGANPYQLEPSYIRSDHTKVQQRLGGLYRAFPGSCNTGGVSQQFRI